MANLNLKTISQLPEVSSENLVDGSYFGVSVPSKTDQANGNSYIYASKKISKESLGKAMTSAVVEYYRSNNGLSDGVKVGQLNNDFYRFANGPDFTVLNPNLKFASASKIDETVSNYFDESAQKKAVNVETMKKYLNQASTPAIGPGFGFVASLSSVGNGASDNQVYYNLFKIDEEGKTNGDYNYGLTPDVGKNISENQFAFRIEPGKKESNVLTAPATGVFTCYGWLDEIQNEKVSNESRWVALMGQKSFSNGADRRWVILQVQPFIANNYLSYVSFTFPVKAGMLLKIQTGFTVGSNSDKYFKSQSALANHVANAFIGGVYTGLSIDSENIVTGYGNVDDITIHTLCSLICTQISHEISCDEELEKSINDLNKRVATNDTVNALSNAIDLRVKYIDTLSYGSETLPKKAELFMYNKVPDPKTHDGEEFDNDYNQRIDEEDEPLVYYSLDTILDPKQEARYYYAPPTHTETYLGEEGTVELAYRDGAFPYGKIVTDNNYLYYIVSQNCNLMVRLYSDQSGTAANGIAAYLLLPNSSVVKNSKKAIPIGKALEYFGGTDPHETYFLPVKKGSVVMFYPWHTQYRTASGGPFISAFYDDDPSIMRYNWIGANAPCVIPYSDDPYVTVENLTSTTEIRSSATIHGNVCYYMSYGLRVSDKTLRDKLVNTDGQSNPNKFSHIFGNDNSDNNRGRIASVVELPT